VRTSWSISPAWRTSRWRWRHIVQPATAGRAPPLLCGRVRGSSRIVAGSGLLREPTGRPFLFWPRAHVGMPPHRVLQELGPPSVGFLSFGRCRPLNGG
jgi:hypothetical protein